MKFVRFLFFICLISCQDSNKQDVEVNIEQNSQTLISQADIENLKYIEFLPDIKVKKQISGWEKYSELDRIVEDVKAANLSFFKGNSEIVNALCEELKSTIPESMNTPQIFSRVVALETKIFKLENFANQSNPKKELVLGAVEEFLIAFSNFNLQMNKKIEKESQNIQKPN
ncbi:hypothetical protein [Hanstruepera ponticola]|uniref:hypothetical protein n=1 Tax=Hanstruepera ponticola TaxID=2042995 RepID=UPI000CF097E1|nr:hypothetical protein [Hanstruepera ponticola]